MDLALDFVTTLSPTLLSLVAAHFIAVAILLYFILSSEMKKYKKFTWSILCVFMPLVTFFLFLKLRPLEKVASQENSIFLRKK